jgi:hypothetical protein
MNVDSVNERKQTKIFSSDSIKKPFKRSYFETLSGLSNSFSNFSNQISNQVSSIILYPNFDSPKWEKKRKEIQEKLGAENIQVPSSDGFLLDGMLFPPYSKNDLLSKKALVFAPGADGYYEDNFSFYFVSLIKQKLGDINVIILNYPSVMKSKGNLNPDSMASTVVTSCKYLIEEKGISPDDIIIYGQSLGGVAAVRGARNVQRKYPQAHIKLISERSFLNLPDVVHGYFKGGNIGKCMQSMTTFASWTTTDVLECWQELKGAKLIIYSEFDGVVLKTHSLYQAVKYGDSQDTPKVLMMEGSEISPKEHWRTFTEKEEDAIVQEMVHMFELH